MTISSMGSMEGTVCTTFTHLARLGQKATRLAKVAVVARVAASIFESSVDD